MSSACHDSEASNLPQGTRFAGWRRGPAAALLLTLAAAVAWCVWVACTQETVPTHPKETRGDAEFYRDIVGRVHSGEAYYDAVENGLRERGYTPHSVFNWRTPVYAWAFGKPPSPLWAQSLLIVLALTTLFLGYRVVRQDGGQWQAALAIVLLLGPFEWMLFPDVALFTELWAGTLIAFSICSQALGRPRLAVLCGIAALFFRELTLPYCLVELGIAVWQKRLREAAGWLIGLALYAAFMAWHVAQVRHRIDHFGVMHAQGWLQWNGTAFILLTCQINYYLLQAPSWLAAIYLPLGLLGLASWKTSAGLRMLLTTVIYVAAFSVIGFKPHNAYWGLMYAPLLAFGVAWAPAAVSDLIAVAFRPAEIVRRRPLLAGVEGRP